MQFKRSSGVLLHVSSLPSYGGIGDLGPAAHEFVAFLAAASELARVAAPRATAHGGCLGFYAIPGEREWDGTGTPPWDDPSNVAHSQPGRPVPRIADLWLLKKFHEHFPGLYYFYGQRWRETNDGTIPHRLFLLLLTTIGMTEAGDLLRGAQSVALGMGLAMSGDDSGVQSAARAVVQRAYPERFD